MILTCSLGCQWIGCWRKIGGRSQKLAVSDVGWISRWRNHGWGSAMPTPPTCISVWLKWNPRLQVFPMCQRLIQLTSETASFWLRPPILHQHLIHRHPRPQACSTQLLQSSTATSNLLRATKKLSYGSSLSWGWRNNIVGLAKQYRGVGDGYRRAQQYLVNHRGAGDRSNGILNTV